jgi:hypothetical protein
MDNKLENRVNKKDKRYLRKVSVNTTLPKKNPPFATPNAGTVSRSVIQPQILKYRGTPS